MAVRAKMRVTGRHEFTSAGKGDPIRQVQVTLQPVFSGTFALLGVGGWLFLFAAVIALRHLW